MIVYYKKLNIKEDKNTFKPKRVDSRRLTKTIKSLTNLNKKYLRSIGFQI